MLKSAVDADIDWGDSFEIKRILEETEWNVSENNDEEIQNSAQRNS